ncbi:hypothetical protein H634G_04931 [Metarhizium anisopliae BRIP 53293]|uniref:Uncharacterized protein n=1 Tax=Metarhizium anisopliae BRIP 53293 TaxID=1291518 RepID=A0A0D9P3D9_METAN|nr:hypothetical protein H634G_04931 [Metarhizium anisopliae BRIP 53293]
MAGDTHKLRDDELTSTTAIANSPDAPNTASHGPTTTMDNNASASATAEKTVSRSKSRRRRASAVDEENYSIPDAYLNLDELAAPCPVENVTDGPVYRHSSLEVARSHEREWRTRRSQQLPEGPLEAEEEARKGNVSQLLTQLYTLSYLVFFSLMGTLARLGLTALTHYVDTPVIFTTIWANFGGSLIMGFLAEDRMLFRHEWGTPTYDQTLARAKGRSDEESASTAGSASGIDLAAAKKEHLATKKTIPLYIGLATGFCGSFTSFSTFIRDVFLAMSNDIVAPGFGTEAQSRNGGYSFMAMLAVIITTVGLSLAALVFGAHFAIATERIIPSIPFPITRRVLDPLFVLLGWGCWLGAVLMSIFPPHDQWRGKATFALVFAPLGCLARFYLAIYLNGKIAAFPLGTFAANVIGTAVLGMAWDIAHVQSGGIIGCQVLQGVEDGFCGCLTTVSTWVAELNSLRRRNAYVYGATSIVVSFAVMVLIMGGLRWTDGCIFFQGDGSYPHGATAEPIAEWPMEFLDFQAGPLQNDVYGKLFYYLRDTLVRFQEESKRLSIMVGLTSVGMPMSLHRAPEPVMYDRIHMGDLWDFNPACSLTIAAGNLRHQDQNPFATMLAMCRLSVTNSDAGLREEICEEGYQTFEPSSTILDDYAPPIKIEQGCETETVIRRRIGLLMWRNWDKFSERFMQDAKLFAFHLSTDSETDKETSVFKTGFLGMEYKDKNTITRRWPNRLVHSKSDEPSLRDFERHVGWFDTMPQRWLEWKRVADADDNEWEMARECVLETSWREMAEMQAKIIEEEAQSVDEQEDLEKRIRELLTEDAADREKSEKAGAAKKKAKASKRKKGKKK